MQNFPAYRYDGDKDAAAALRLTAQNLLHQAREIDKVSASRVTKLNRSTPLGEVEVLIIEGQEYVNIVATPRGQRRELDKANWYIDVYSGLVRGNEVVGGEGLQNKLRDYNPTQDAFDNPLGRADGKQPGMFHDEELLVPPSGRAPKATASSFSGLMAKMVQFLNGYGAIDLHSHPTAKPTGTDRDILLEGVDTSVFSYSFNKTHGLIRDPQSKALWMVEVGRDGLFAAPLPMLGVTADELQVELPIPLVAPDYDAVREGLELFGGFPSGREFDEEIPGRVTLLSETQMRQFYGENCYPHHPLMGWTFNAKGDEAANVRIRYQGGGSYAGDPETVTSAYAYGSLWRVNFTFSDGVPAASISMLEEDFLSGRFAEPGNLGVLGGSPISPTSFEGFGLYAFMPRKALVAQAAEYFTQVGYLTESGGITSNPTITYPAGTPQQEAFVTFLPDGPVCMERIPPDALDDPTTLTFPRAGTSLSGLLGPKYQFGGDGGVAPVDIPITATNLIYFPFGLFDPPKNCQAPVFCAYHGDELVTIRLQFVQYSYFPNVPPTFYGIETRTDDPLYPDMYSGYAFLTSDAPKLQSVLRAPDAPVFETLPPGAFAYFEGNGETNGVLFDGNPASQRALRRAREYAQSVPPPPYTPCQGARATIPGFGATQEERDAFFALVAEYTALTNRLQAEYQRSDAMARLQDQIAGQALREQQLALELAEKPLTVTGKLLWTFAARDGFCIEEPIQTSTRNSTPGVAFMSTFTPTSVQRTSYAINFGLRPVVAENLTAPKRKVRLQYSVFGPEENVIYQLTPYESAGPDQGIVVSGNLFSPGSTPTVGSIFEFIGYI